MPPMLGLQFDSVSPLPFVPALEALYVNGRFAHTPVAYGPGRVWIDVLGNAPRAAFWLDVEKGDATPDMVPAWLDARHAAGDGWGGVYCNRSSLGDVAKAAGNRPWSLWLATLDGSLPLGLGLPSQVNLLAVQAFPAAAVGINADVSVVLDPAYWGRRR